MVAWNLYFLFTFLLKSPLSLHFSIETAAFSLLEISTFSLLFYWNLSFSLYFSIENTTLSLLLYWNLYFLFTCLLKIPTFSLLFGWNLYFPITFLWKSFLSLHFPMEISIFLYFSIETSIFSIETSTFSLLYFFFTFLLKPLLFLYFSNLHPTIIRRLAICSCIPKKYDCTTRNSAQPSAHHYKASGNLQLHSPIIFQTTITMRNTASIAPA